MIFVADTLGRRGALLYTSAIMFVLMYVVGVYGKVEPPEPGKPVSSYESRRHQ